MIGAGWLLSASLMISAHAALPVPAATPTVVPSPGASATPAVSAEAQPVASPAPALTDPREVATQVRDPFKRPDVNQLDNTPRTELEYFPTEQYKLLGILTGTKRTQAMVLSPNGRTYMLYEKMKIGVRKGVVESITPERVRVRERVINVLGKEETTVTEIKVSEQRPSGG